TSSDICFQSAHPLMLGHSQGGLTGSVTAAFEDEIPSYMLSGAGGGTTITVVEPGSANNNEGLIRLLLKMTATDEPLTDLHPVLTLLQTLADVTDPINYAAHWTSTTNVMLTSGLTDPYTPAKAANALAR